MSVITLAAMSCFASCLSVFAQDDVLPRKFALLVGVNKYKNRKVSNLSFAGRDVEETGETLKDLGFNVHFLTGSSKGYRRATKANIEEALKVLLEDVRAQDIVLIGYSGHGVQLPEKKEDAFLFPVDGKISDSSTLLSLSELLKTLDQRGGSICC
ncbi:MAG: caspase family protein [Planctomycetaceae bacterium]|nr:caspase family protein [Planctomycetaceae bacterium]